MPLADEVAMCSMGSSRHVAERNNSPHSQATEELKPEEVQKSECTGSQREAART